MRCRDCPYGIDMVNIQMKIEPINQNSLFGVIKLVVKYILLVIVVIGMNKTKKIIRIILRKRE